MRRSTAILLGVISMGLVAWMGAWARAADWEVSPPSVMIDSPESTWQLLVREKTGAGVVDRTRQATYASSQAQIAAVDELGLIQPLADGQAEIIVRLGPEERRVPVLIRGTQAPLPISFEHQILPIFTKAGCNAGGCHGKAEGQNGFKLSVFGNDPPADYQALMMEGRGRRVFPAAPEHSLLVRKAIAETPHGGGLKIDPGSLRHRRLLRWIREGARPSVEEIEPTVAIELEPAAQSLVAHGQQQLRVVAVDAAGVRRCVTTEAEYSSNAATIADVDNRGLVAASDVPGEAAILARYLGHVAVARITVPRPGVAFARPPENNFIDRLAWDKLAQLGIEPSGLADDAAFLRRVSLDVLGTLPRSDEVRAFVASTDPQKRARLIDNLLDRPEYADYWAMRWADILRVDRDRITPQGSVAMTRWLRRQVAENRPYDQMVRDIITAQGDTAAESPAALYKVLDTPELLSRSISQVFLGVRIECAQCHHHPFERWGQDDYFGLAGFFTGVKRKAQPGAGEIVFVSGATDLPHPRTKATVPARALGAAAAEFAPGQDRRQELARWMTAPENPFLAPAIVNRLWSHYFGRGLVDPNDDLRATNPATNEPLLQALAAHLKEQRFDLKALTRTMLNSRLYQLSNEATATNVDDEQNFSRARHKALPAEVLLDAISQATDVPEKFPGWPAGYRAIQVWDNRVPSYFFQIFGRPVRASVCECERSNEPSIAQALHLINSNEVSGRLSQREGIARKLAESMHTPEEIVAELFLRTLSRYPRPEELAAIVAEFQQPGAERRQTTEDALWALLNTKEFLLNH